MEGISTFTYFGKIKGINSSDGMLNLLVTLPEGNDINIKTESNHTDIKIGYIYKMKVARHSNSDRNVFYLLEYMAVREIEDINEQDMCYRLFDSRCKESLESLEEKIYCYLDKVKNKVIKDITKALLDENKKSFFIYPAAQRFHHNYVGGLAYHTIGMLELAESFIKNYPYLDKDYLYAGVILHDLGKIKEFSGIENTEYTTKGQLLGHLVMGGIDIAMKARELGYDETEEAMLLEHMVISHHGQPMFGAAKKPQTPEAAALWYIDTLDSKFRVLGEEMENCKPGAFTDQIGVLDKTKFYKKNH